MRCIVWQSPQKELPSLKLTANAPEAMDGWKTILSFWNVWAYFQGQLLLVSGSVRAGSPKFKGFLEGVMKTQLARFLKLMFLKGTEVLSNCHDGSTKIRCLTSLTFLSQIGFVVSFSTINLTCGVAVSPNKWLWTNLQRQMLDGKSVCLVRVRMRRWIRWMMILTSTRNKALGRGGVADQVIVWNLALPSWPWWIKLLGQVSCVYFFKCWKSFVDKKHLSEIIPH